MFLKRRKSWFKMQNGSGFLNQEPNLKTNWQKQNRCENKIDKKKKQFYLNLVLDEHACKLYQHLSTDFKSYYLYRLEYHKTFG